MRAAWRIAVVALAGCGRLHFGSLGTITDATSGDGAIGAHHTYIKASNPDAFDAFGGALALSADGSTLAVGAIDEDSGASGIDGNQSDNSVSRAGAAYVFVRAGATWVQQAYVKASNPSSGDVFGFAVALSDDGNTLAVGANQENSAATGIDGNQGDQSAPNAGAVYVFVRTGVTWAQQVYVKASNTEAADSFGSSVALSADGNTLAVGATAEASAATGVGGNQADNTAAGAGAVYVFTRAGAAWSQQAYIKASNTDANDHFGTSLALAADGSTLAVGAVGEASGSPGVNGNQTDNTQGDAGAVYVFARAGAVWSQQAYLKGTPAIGGDFVGEAIAVSADGNTLVAGAPAEDSVQLNSGGVFVFTRSGASWTAGPLLKASNAGNNDQFGFALSLASGRLLIGALLEDSAASGIGGNQLDDSLSDAGAAYLFEGAGAQWTQTTYLKATVPGSGDKFGSTVGVSASVIAVGAPAEDSASPGIDGTPNKAATDSGAVYIYD